MRLTLLAAAAALSLGAGASLAQPAPPTGPGAPHGPHIMQRPDPAQMAERHAEHLRAALQLRPDQEPALRAFIAAMRPPQGAMGRMHDQHDGMQNLTTPQRLDRLQAKMAEHEQMFRQHADAIRRFYAQLTPAQQKAFDAMPMMGHGMGHMGGHEGMGGMHGHGMHGMKHGPGSDEHAPPPPPPGR